MDELDHILTNIDLEEEKLETEEKDWYCGDCEHGPMMDSDTHCSRCGTKNSQFVDQEITGWENEDEMEGVEEIW